MILSIFAGLLALSPAHAASTSAVCKSADSRWVWTASSEEFAQASRDGRTLNIHSEIVDEQDHEEEQPGDPCSLGKLTATANTIDRYRATLVVGDQRIPVSCESIFSMQVSCEGAEELGGLGGIE